MNGSVEKVSLLSIFKNSIKSNLRQYTMIFALIAIGVIFYFSTPDHVFMTSRNLSTLFLQTAVTAILAIGMVLIIVAGHIDLSVGSVCGFTGAVAAVLQVGFNMPTIPTILITLTVGALIGVWHGFWVSYCRVPSFIVTLASMFIFRGLLLTITGGNTIGPMKDAFKAIGQEYIPRLFPNNTMNIHDTSLILCGLAVVLFIIFDLRNRRNRIKYGFPVLPWKAEIIRLTFTSVVIGAVGAIMILYQGVPYSVLLVLTLVFILNFIATNTIFGRHLYAIGGNKDAARLSGINIVRKTFLLFVLMGVLTAIAGILTTARLNAATTDAGKGYELNAIASAVIGGTSLMGGEGSIPGAIIGALVMGSLDNGMSLMDLKSDLQDIVKGLILLLAVWADMATRQKE